LLAGAALAGGSGPARSVEGENGTDEQHVTGEAPVALDDDMVGVVVVARSSPTAKEAAQPDEIPNGTYLVRWSEDKAAIELVANDGRVAATIPMHGDPVGEDRSAVSEREDDEVGDVPLFEPSAKGEEGSTGARSDLGTNDWTDVYVAILHWLDPRFRS
jgi:hypothetical protein